MKATILLLSVFLSLVSCSKDSSSSGFQLPPETQTGANTFGVTIKGKVYIPRDPTGHGIGPTSTGMTLWGATNYSWYEIEVKDGASAVGFNMFIHMQPLAGVGQIMLHQSNFHNNVDSTPFSHIYFKIWDANISNYAYYGSIENQGEINIPDLKTIYIQVTLKENLLDMTTQMILLQ